jgi:hypothetical protein
MRIKNSSKDIGKNCQKLNYKLQANLYSANGLKHMINPSQRYLSKQLALVKISF